MKRLETPSEHFFRIVEIWSELSDFGKGRLYNEAEKLGIEVLAKQNKQVTGNSRDSQKGA